MTMRLAIGLVLVGVLASCEKDPGDPQTWIDKLDDRKEMNDALRHLERMGDPSSVKPLGEAWKKQNKPSNILRVLISVAGQKDPKTGKAAWTNALPYLQEAVESFDVAASRSIDDAVVACDALGRSGDPSVIPTLMNAAQKRSANGEPLPKLSPANHVRIACTRALGHFRDPKVADVLIHILETDPDKQLIRLNAAAALALAESGDPKALPALINAMFFMPAIFQQVRQAVTRVGKPAIPELLALFQEKDPEVAKKAHDKNFEKTAPGNIVYKSALLLGDLRVKEAVPLLTAALKAEPKIAFYDEKSGAPGPTTHDGILGALRLIMDPGSAPAVRAYLVDPKTYDGTRPTAMDVYSMIAPDDSALADLWKFAKDEKEEAPIRLAAIVAYGRLARAKDQEKPLLDMAQVYEDKLKKAEDKLKAATKDDEKAVAEDEGRVAGYWRDALHESVQRIEIAVECKQDPACYAKALPPTTRDFRPGGPGLPRAERALLEIGKMGERARAQTDALLAGADTTERFVRQGILLALPRIAALPCTKCADRLGQIIDKQAETSTLDFLTGETRIVYHYFLWAGK
jgi:HEAT repeat protein